MDNRAETLEVGLAADLIIRSVIVGVRVGVEAETVFEDCVHGDRSQSELGPVPDPPVRGRVEIGDRSPMLTLA